jgi:putative transposase
MEKVAPSERFRSELDEVLAGVAGEHDSIEAVGRLGARLILQQALEDEVTEFLGRQRYERAGETVSHRNGHESRMVKTTSGSVALERPRIRNASKLGFESWVLGKGVTRTHALESLVISSFLRGLSTRDVEAALEEVFEEPIASKATVSRICEDTRERYRQWCQRRLERIRTTNLLERTFVEVRRRTKVIGRFPGETSALSLIWAVLELSSRGWRGVKMNPQTIAEIERLRRQLRDNPAAPPATTNTKEVITA